MREVNVWVNDEKGKNSQNSNCRHCHNQEEIVEHFLHKCHKLDELQIELLPKQPAVQTCLYSKTEEQKTKKKTIRFFTMTPAAKNFQLAATGISAKTTMPPSIMSPGHWLSQQSPFSMFCDILCYSRIFTLLITCSSHLLFPTSDVLLVVHFSFNSSSSSGSLVGLSVLYLSSVLICPNRDISSNNVMVFFKICVQSISSRLLSVIICMDFLLVVT